MHKPAAFSLTHSVVRPVRRAWNAASAAFAEHPFLIKTVTSAGGFAFGDMLMQLGSAPRRTPLRQRVDAARTGKMGAAGLVAAGPVGYAFILLMELVNPSHSKLALATKVTLDQVLGFVIWHASLAAIHAPHREALAALGDRAVAPLRRQLLEPAPLLKQV
eukprot:scaffold1.g5519.t1